MIRFDHAVIATSDLDRTIARYRALGFDVAAGETLPDAGRDSACVFFDLNHIRLLAVAGERAHSPSHLQMQFAPLPRAWAQPRGAAWGWSRPSVAARSHLCPFHVEPLDLDVRPPTHRQPGAHQNGVIRCQGVAVAVQDLERAIAEYQEQLDLEPLLRDEVPALASSRAILRVGCFQVDLLAPYGDGLVQRQLDAAGEMPFELRLAVRDLKQTRAFFAALDPSLTPEPETGDRLVLTPAQTFSTRLVLEQEA